VRPELRTSNYSNGLQTRFLAIDTVLCVHRVGRARETRHELDGPEIEFRWGGEIFRTFPDRPEPHPASYIMGTGYLFWGYSGRELALTTHLHLAPRLKSEYSLP